MFSGKNRSAVRPPSLASQLPQNSKRKTGPSPRGEAESLAGPKAAKTQSRKCPTIERNSPPNCASSTLEAAFPRIATEE
ncbi:hypothetical protein RS3R6_40730 [Pseudomonas atacamensis]|uniref:Uncharacterized protein n=1 Tax=Pseudomonas atacamensis TaxID=2565368 RepID=A0ABQ5PPI4_9PSED|nr:hypothetical protein RS3R1_44930 [Pseudomonas atacamensis]GLH55891.1 hypothetical protein RS3R6_40730 [Pseudomonas atacamensis]